MERHRLRSLLWLLTLLLLLSGGMRLRPAIAAPAAANLLINGDFEAQWRGWSFHALGTGVGNMHPQAARSGSYGALIRGGGTIRQTVTGLAPRTTYTLSGFVRSTRANSPTLLQVSDYGSATVAQSTGGQEWEALSLTFTTGPQATSAVVSVVAPQSDDRIHYADDLSLTLAAAPATNTNRSGRQYQPLELALQATRAAANPYREVQLSATFRGPDGEQVSVAGFWDGGDTWRVRFTPTKPGSWRYQTSSEPADPGLSQSGTISVAKAASDSHGFLRVEGRHFAFDDGAPFFMLGTTGYTLARTALGGGDYRAFLDGSAAHGITKLRTLVYPWDSETPFAYRSPFVDDNHDRPDIAYWQALDRVVTDAAERSLVVDLILFADHQPAFGSLAQNQRYVRTILARYAAFPNVIWTLTNEWEATGKSSSYWNAIGALVQKEDPYGTNTEGLRRLLSIHNQTGGASGGRFAFTGQAWPTHAVVQYGVRNGTTTFGDVWAQQSILRNVAPGWPVVNDEIGYLGEGATNPAGTAVMDRTTQRQALWAAYLAGGSATVGDTAVVQGAPVWRSGLWHDTGGAHDDILRLADFFTSRAIPFWTMVSRNDLVISGTRVYVLAGDRDLVVYAAAGGTVEIALPPGTWEATRYSPRSATTSALATASGSAHWGLGSQDWVIHLHRR